MQDARYLTIIFGVRRDHQPQSTCGWAGDSSRDEAVRSCKRLLLIMNEAWSGRDASYYLYASDVFSDVIVGYLNSLGAQYYYSLCESPCIARPRFLSLSDWGPISCCLLQ